MATDTFINYTASGVYSGITNVINALSKFVIEKFPIGTIKSLHVDDRVNIQNLYRNVIDSYRGETTTKFNNVEEITKIPRPHCYVGWSLESGFDTEETGLSTFPLYHYPHAHFFDDEMVGVNPILWDPVRKIFVGTQHLRIKVTSEFLINCTNKDEQITLYTYLKNNLKDMYMYAVPNISTNYTMQSSLLIMLKNVLYGDNTPFSSIKENFDKYLHKYSNGGIIPVYRNNKKDDIFYELLYDYRQIDFKLTGRMQIDDGEKKDQVYSNYTIRFPTQAEFYIPNNYILKMPEMVVGTNEGIYQVPDNILLSNETDKDNNVQIMNVIKKKTDTIRRRYVSEDYELIAKDEFGIETEEDYYEIRRLFNRLFLLFYDKLNEEEKKACFDIRIYQGETEIIENTSINWVDFIVNFKSNDIMNLFTIEVYLNTEKFKTFLLGKLKEDFIFELIKLVLMDEYSLIFLLKMLGFKNVEGSEMLELFKKYFKKFLKITDKNIIDIFFSFILELLNMKFIKSIYEKYNIPYDSTKEWAELLKELLMLKETSDMLLKEIVLKLTKENESLTVDKAKKLALLKLNAFLKEAKIIGLLDHNLNSAIKRFTVTLFNGSKPEGVHYVR